LSAPVRKGESFSSIGTANFTGLSGATTTITQSRPNNYTLTQALNQ